MKNKRIIALALAAACVLSAPLTVFAEVSPSDIAVSQSDVAADTADTTDTEDTENIADTISPVTAQASATSGECGDNVTWSLNEDTGVLTIDGTGDMWNGKEIDLSWKDCEKVTKVVINPGVTSIGSRAFFDCENLEEIDIANTVTHIGDAFGYNFAIERLTIPASVQSIDADALDLPNLKSITVDSGNAYYTDRDGILFNKSMSELICYPAEKAGTAYTIPSSVTKVAEKAFWWQTNLQSVTVPDSVKMIGNSAFEGCMALRDVVIGDSVTSIKGAFYNCESLTTLTIGKSVTSIDLDYETIPRTSTLKSIKVSEENKTYTDVNGVLYSKDLSTLLFIPGNVKEYTVPANVTLIGENALGGWNLSKLTVLNPDCEITDDTAYDMVIVGYKGSTAEEFAEEQYCPFVDIDNQVVNGTCGDNLTWSLNVNTGAFTIDGKGEMKFEPNEWEEILPPWYDYTKLIKSVTFTGNVTSIDDYAFMECENLVSVTIPNTVKSIGADAFSDSGLREVTVPSSVTFIGDYAFYRCVDLKKVTLPDTLPDIGEFVFSGCVSLTDINIPSALTAIPNGMFGNYEWGEGLDHGCHSLKSIVVPDKVQSIGVLAFSDCESLTRVVIPKSVTTIGEYAFYECDSLKDIYYKGTEAEWNAIKTEYLEDADYEEHYNFRKHLSNVTIHYNYGQSAALAITSQPSNVVAKNNAWITFKVGATGEGLTYQWQLSDDAGKTWRNSSIKTASYSTTLTDKNDGRQVRCIVTDKNGSKVTSNAASMKITSLKITTQPTNATVKKGATASFKVKAAGEGLTYQWQLSDDQGKTWRNSKATTANYSAAVYDSNNGRYVRCIVTDKYGNSVKSNAAIMKITTLKITTQPTNANVKKGETASFKVAATGSGVTYQWQLSDDKGMTWRNSKATGQYYSATVTDVTNGRYVRCIVTDKFGNSVKSNAAIMKITKLQILTQPANVIAKKGATASFKVVATGNTLTYQWQLSDDQGKTWRNSKATGAFYSAALTDSTNGRYVRCIVKDKFGNTVTSNAAVMRIGIVQIG